MHRWQYYRYRIPWRLLVVFVVLAALLLTLNMKVKPLMRDIAALEAKKYASQIVGEIVQKELSESGITYEDLTVIQRDGTGRVLSISSDVVKLNELKARLVTAVQDTLAEKGHGNVGVPVGTLFGGELFHGYGPKVPLRVTLSGSVTAEFQSTFDEAGVNQTRHRIALQLQAGLYAFLPGVDSTTDFTTDIPVAETVIVGEVPTVMADFK